MPKVSVIMLTWNSGVHLRTAVESILGQTMRELELLLVDNGTTDGSVDAVLAAHRDPRIKLVRHATNLGIGRGFNSAVPLAAAPWIARMDADDWSHPQRLELQLRAVEADPRLEVIGTAAEWMDEEGRVLGPYAMFYDPEDIRRYLPYNMAVLNPTLLARAETFRTALYQPELELVEDYDWAVRVVERHRIGVLSIPLFRYRRHGGSVTVGRHTLSQAMAAVVRLVTARRRAGRDEGLADLAAEARTLAAMAKRCAPIYRHFGRRCSEDGFPLLATFHSALEVRDNPTPGAMARYLRHLFAAIRSVPGGWRQAIGGIGRAPFWMLLRESGFPAFPRY